MTEAHILVSQQKKNGNANNQCMDITMKSIKINMNNEETDIDYDSDSDDGFNVIKKKTNESPLNDQIECIHDILCTILAIPSFNSTFREHITSHNDLFTDLLKTHITTTNDIHLLSLLYVCVHLLIQTKSEIGLLCFNRIRTLSVCYDSGFNTNENEAYDGYSIHKKSLRLLTKMVHIYGSHLLSMIYQPLNQHLNPSTISMDYQHIHKQQLLRSASILQIGKLYEMGDEYRSMIDNEWKYKQQLYDIIKDRDNDYNMNINIIQNTWIALQIMAHHNKYKSVRKYCSISCKVQMIIIDQLLNIIHHKSNNTFGMDVILDGLSCDLLNNHLSIAYICSVSQQLQSFIKHKTSDIHHVSNVMSAIKALIKCLRIIETKPKTNMNEIEIEEYIECISHGITNIVHMCHIHNRCELLWSILNDVCIVLRKYPSICKYWTSKQMISSFGLIFNDKNYVKKNKLSILCTIIECIGKYQYLYDMTQCQVIIAALNSYLLDVVDTEIINEIMHNTQKTIYSLLSYYEYNNSIQAMHIMNALFGLISTNTLRLLSSPELFIIKYSYFVRTINHILMRFKQYKLPKDNESFSYLCKDYHTQLVQNIVSFYLTHVHMIHDGYFVQSVVYLTGEYCEYLNNEQIFNVFNYILPTFLNETTNIQLCIITAITKIYLKINNESKILPLLQHIYALCNHNNHLLFNLDIRCRATMYQRLLKYDINAAKQIVLSIPKPPSHDDNDDTKMINDAIDHDLCRLSGIYHKSEKEFVDVMYVQLEESDSDYDTEQEEDDDDDDDDEEEGTEYHSSDDEEYDEYQDYKDYTLVVDAQVGEGVEIALKIDINYKHKILFVITNKTAYDIYQIDMKFNKNYLGAQSLKTLLNNKEIIKVNETKKLRIPLKLIQKSHVNIDLNNDCTDIQTAIRYFQQQLSPSGGKMLSRESKCIFFNVSIPGFIFFNEFRDNTANSNYMDKVSSMKSISRKCEMNINIKDDDDTELIINQIIMECFECKKIKELKEENEKKMIYMALLQFKWVLIGICIHFNAKCKSTKKGKYVIVDIVTKSNHEWLSEAAMQSVKFGILAEKQSETFH